MSRRADKKHDFLRRSETLSVEARREHRLLKVYRERALAVQDHRCAYCRDPLTRLTATADHRLPKARGGLTEIDNIKVACRPCNSVKGMMSESQFLRVIKTFPEGKSVSLMLAWSRRRLNLATERAERNILRAVGKSVPSRET